MYLTARVVDQLTNPFVSTWAEGSTQSLRDIRTITNSFLVRFWDCPYLSVARFCKVAMERVLERRTFLVQPRTEPTKLCPFAASLLEVCSTSENFNNVKDPRVSLDSLPIILV
jgi:hypothetical protein